MSSTVRDAVYDENLLASAPEATKEQLQSGYTTDLLKPKTKQPRRVKDLEAGQVNPEKQNKTQLTATDSSPAISKIAPLPFYRTRKGIIIISVVVIVVLGAVIGGAVGGTQRKKVHAVADNPVSNGGQSGAAGTSEDLQTGHSPTPTSSTLANSQTQVPPEIGDFASLQGLGSSV